MSAHANTITTARLRPELFPEQIVNVSSRALVVAALSVIVLLGLGFRAYRLDAQGLSEDELNKVRAVEEYRARGLTPANGEHPFLMKAMLTASAVAADWWNSTDYVRTGPPSYHVTQETWARLPGAILGALTSVLIFLVALELFGAEVAFIAAALWAFDPAAVTFNRIAKEDSFLVFFFLLANVFWLRGQRAAEEGRRPEPFYWASGVAFGAMLASKYVPHFIAISGSYYYVFQGMKTTRWRIGKRRWLIFFIFMGVAFVIFNPTILLPGTWHEMRTFAGERRIAHDSNEFMGVLYPNQMSLWLRGVPWYFYYVFMAVKLPLTVAATFVVGLFLLFRRRVGDGRYFILFWLFFWFFPFSVLGGKFTRYFTFALPAVLITSAVGVHFFAQYFARATARLGASGLVYARALTALLFACVSVYATARAAPFYPLYTNALGSALRPAGDFFPHDEFYDSGVRDAARETARMARPGARVASETPELLQHYARLAGREDLTSVSLSDPSSLAEMRAGDLVVTAPGRRYFSNSEILARLNAGARPASVVRQGAVEAARVYLLDEESVAALTAAAAR
ncbi:MAG TPA: glycosyltransferase family 39 protein [Pyrinomonadaceae bacterium]|nr:glycosyltransferase family 39 protein [Pyrinomonadaceae bacterium]